MLDLNKLYSYKRQEPTVLPHRITLSDGRSRTDVTTFTDEEIIDAGFTGPYVKPEYDQNLQEIIWNGESLIWIVNHKVLPQPQIVEKSDDDLFYMLRQKRNFLLSTSDWTQTLDSPLSEEEINLWKLYRQELRDLPSSIDNIREFDIQNDFPIPNF